MIGIFDSGVGGMTVARAVEKILPSYRLIYFGDLARTPYGTKSPETIIEYSLQNTRFLLSLGAKIIIIACNSAASVGSEVLKEQFDIPIFEVISPAVHKVIKSTQTKRVGVIGTRATIKSRIYQEKIAEISPDIQVFSQPCPLLVPLVEEGWTHKQETKMILRRYLYPLKLKKIDSLVLGCTHYPLLADLIRAKIGNKKVELIDSSEEVADNLKHFLDQNPGINQTLIRGGNNLYYVSDVTEAAKLTARKIFGRKIELIKA